MKERFHLLTLVTNKGNTATTSYLPFIETCINAGVTSVQLREKSLSHEALFQFGLSLKCLLDKKRIPLIINDNVDLCLKLDASGVHLGQSDMTASKARFILGPQKIIGLSTNTIEEIKHANQQPIDYIGVGAISPTLNKPNIETIWGLDGLKEASLISSLPIIAIGGIDENNALSVMHAGADGIAAIGCFHKAKDPFLAAQNLITILKEAKNDR